MQDGSFFFISFVKIIKKGVVILLDVLYICKYIKFNKL